MPQNDFQLPMDGDLPNVADILDDNATFDPAALAAVRELARSRPWRGDDAERLAKLNACAAKLAAAYQHDAWTFALGLTPSIDREQRVVTLSKPSVVTFLNIMALVRGQSMVGAFRWSINIFKRCFPRSFAACRQVGPLLIRDDE
jgi:hypothetical protein